MARIWFQLWVCYHPGGLEIATEGGTRRLDPALLRELQVEVRVDVVPDTAWSSYAREQSLEAALQAGHITCAEYVDSLPETAAAPRARVRRIREARQEKLEHQRQLLEKENTACYP